MKCPECGTDNPEGAEFCSECGTKMPASQPSTGETKLVETEKKNNLSSTPEQGIGDWYKGYFDNYCSDRCGRGGCSVFPVAITFQCLTPGSHSFSSTSSIWSCYNYLRWTANPSYR